MGGGNWTFGSYDARVKASTAAGKSSFDYTDRIASGQTATAVHELLDPRTVAGPLSPFAGKVMREVTISAEHPNPTAIAVVLDVTGSNIDAAKVVHSKLPQLLGVLQRKGYVDDPQINFCAIGDAYSDYVPLQVGQFESDNRIDEQLEAMYLEGNGGGQVCETYELAAYFLARHTYLEPFHQEGRKGFAFFIGDEMPYETLRRQFSGDPYDRGHTVESLTGDRLESDLTTAKVFEELQEQYEVFFLFQSRGMYPAERILPAWRKLLGERALVLDDPAAVCETIAGILAVVEGGYNTDEVMADLTAIGSDASSVQAAGKALATVTGTSVAAKASGSLPDLPDSGAMGTTRL
ncbi:MAG: hypothetical protein ACQR33_01045 [Candidatus Saccharibacteria bacterium]